MSISTLRCCLRSFFALLGHINELSANVTHSTRNKGVLFKKSPDVYYTYLIGQYKDIQLYIVLKS